MAEAPSDFVVFSNPESPRAKAFEDAAVAVGGRPPVFLPWTRVLAGEIPWERFAALGCALRLESPGKNWLVERELLARGAEEPDEEAPGGVCWRRLSAQAVRKLDPDPGRIWPSRQWFLGWRGLLREAETSLSRIGGLSCMNPPQDIVAMFDKAATDRILLAAGAPVPESLGIPKDFEELMETMRARKRWRVFLKPCHGSSASGVVAFEVSGSLMQAWSTARASKTGGEVALHNYRRVRRYEALGEIRELVNAVCRDRAVAQVWMPKAGWLGKRLDLRVVVIGGKACHAVPRLSRNPVTNLQLGAVRGCPAELRRHLGEEAWGRAMACCESAAQAFPRSLYMGVDLLVGPGGGRMGVAEVNAFGDFLPGALHGGKSAQVLELEAFLEREGRTRAPAAQVS